MPRSIASRTFLIVFYSTLISLCASLGFAWWALENLESTVLEEDNRIEVEYFDKYGEKDKPLRVTTAQMIGVYQPKAHKNDAELPLVFQNVPVPFQGEIEALGKDYVVITHAFPEGNYYLAKNLQLFEEHEEHVIEAVLILALVICILALGLAMVASKNISGPVLRLTTQLKNLNSGSAGARLSGNYVDAELNEIANAMNHYLSGMEDVIQRERMLISMASHELKTPVSVVLGAARVIEERGRLGADDAVTLQRIADAANEMSANIHALLNLARRSRETVMESYRWSELFDSIAEDYRIQDPHLADRLQLVPGKAADEMQADRVLVKMLLNNLIGNALNYTQGRVVVELQGDCLLVSDEGAASLTDGAVPPPWQASGLGLYIVDLLCKELGWKYEILPGPEGTRIRVRFKEASPA